MQWYRYPLPRLHHGRYLHPVKIDLTDLQAVELGATAGVEEGQEEDVVLAAPPSCYPENLGQGCRVERSASFGPRSPGKANGTDSPAEGTDALQLRRLGEKTVVGADVAQVRANGRSGEAGIGKVCLVRQELVPTGLVQVGLELLGKKTRVAQENHSARNDGTEPESVCLRHRHELADSLGVTAPVYPPHDFTPAAARLRPLCAFAPDERLGPARKRKPGHIEDTGTAYLAPRGSLAHRLRDVRLPLASHRG